MISRLSYDELFEQALNKVQNRFLLSILLAKRVAQLRKGAEPLVNFQEFRTAEEIVYQEIIDGKLEWRTVETQPTEGDMEKEISGNDFDDSE